MPEWEGLWRDRAGQGHQTDQLPPERGVPLRKLDEVLKNKLSPSASSSLDERTAFCELSQPDWREAELFNQGPHRGRRAFVVARKEHDAPPSSFDVRVLAEDSCGEMVE